MASRRRYAGGDRRVGFVRATKRMERVGVAQPPIALVIVPREIRAELFDRFGMEPGLEQFVGQPETGERIVGLLGSHGAEGGETGGHEGES